MRVITFVTCLMSFAAIVHAAAPATQPVAPDVYLLPFTAVGPDTRSDWAGKAVQQNLLTDLAYSKLHPVAADQTNNPRIAAAGAGAKYIITGTYQTSDQMARFTGQIIDVSNGNVVGGISVTGAWRNLFAMEDSLSAQAIQQLNQLPGIVDSPARNVSNKAAGPVPPALQPAALQLVVEPPAVGLGSSYQGSALQSYVDANRTPSTDYSQQLQITSDNNTYGYSNNSLGYYGNYFGNYYGGYGIGLGGGYGFGALYNVGIPSFGYGSGGSFHHGFGGHGGGHGYR